MTDPIKMYDLNGKECGVTYNQTVPDCRDCEHCKRSRRATQFDMCKLMPGIEGLVEHSWCSVERTTWRHYESCGPLGKNFVQRRTWWQKMKGWSR